MPVIREVLARADRLGSVPRAFSLVRGIRNREGLLSAILLVLWVEYQRPSLLFQDEHGSARLGTAERSAGLLGFRSLSMEARRV
jgi:hypothetical protein